MNLTIPVESKRHGNYRIKDRTIEVVFVGCVDKPGEAVLILNGERKNIPWKEGGSRGEISVLVPDSDDGFSVELVFRD